MFYVMQTGSRAEIFLSQRADHEVKGTLVGSGGVWWSFVFFVLVASSAAMVFSLLCGFLPL